MSEPRTVEGGKVIIFEGIDGVGKTTQLNKAAEALENDGWLVKTAMAHGGTNVGEALRAVSKSALKRTAGTDFYLSLAIHQATLAEVVNPAREQGAVILVDRGPLSLASYQIYGDNLAKTRWMQYVGEDFRDFNPDLVITYTAALGIALARAKQKTGAKQDYFESRSTEYFERVSDGFIETTQLFGAVTVDAEQSIEAVHNETMRLIDRTLQA